MPEQKLTTLQAKLSELRREGEERAAERLASQLGIPYVNLGKTPIALDALRLVSEDEAREAHAAPIELKLKEVALAALDPRTPAIKKIIDGLGAKKYTVKVFIASQSSLEQAWHYYRFVAKEVKDITGKVDIEKKRLEELAERLTTLDAVRKEIENFDFKNIQTSMLLEVVLAGALANKASDAHFETEADQVRIRFRVDGLLHDVFNSLPIRNYTALASRIKLLAGLKMNVYGEPQDGRFSIGLVNKEIEVRVSAIPSEFGETIVMRVLDPDAINLSLPDLGIRPDDIAIVERELSKPNGLLLNTGPTGSGKTTTLYAFLKKLASPEIKIITIEDPIEYHLAGIEQTQVNANYTFAHGLRAIVRQDPDVILVGEVRDLETAEIALQAALTGHLVFSTLHTNDAAGVVSRFVDLGVKTTTIGPALNLAIAQRLVRRLCPKCKKPAAISADLKTKVRKFFETLPARVDRKPYEQYAIYEAAGCKACSSLGYVGRVGIFEFLEAGPKFEEIILKEVSELALKRLEAEQQMVTMQQDGILKVLSGVTSFDEIKGATGELAW